MSFTFKLLNKTNFRKMDLCASKKKRQICALHRPVSFDPEILQNPEVPTILKWIPIIKVLDVPRIEKRLKNAAKDLSS